MRGMIHRTSRSMQSMIRLYRYSLSHVIHKVCVIPCVILSGEWQFQGVNLLLTSSRHLAR